MIEQIKPPWGLMPPEGATAAWGARAIFKNGSVDILPDRQGLAVSGASTERLFLDVINRVSKRPGSKACRPMKLASRLAHKLYVRREIDPREEKRVCLYEDEGGLVIEGNTNGSCGYLYLVAYMAPGTDPATYMSGGDASASPKGVSLPPPKAPVRLTRNQTWTLVTLSGIDRDTFPSGWGITKRSLEALRKKGVIDDNNKVTTLGQKAIDHGKAHGYE